MGCLNSQSELMENSMEKLVPGLEQKRGGVHNVATLEVHKGVVF